MKFQRVGIDRRTCCKENAGVRWGQSKVQERAFLKRDLHSSLLSHRILRKSDAKFLPVSTTRAERILEGGVSCEARTQGIRLKTLKSPPFPSSPLYLQSSLPCGTLCFATICYLFLSHSVSLLLSFSPLRDQSSGDCLLDGARARRTAKRNQNPNNKRNLKLRVPV